MKLRILSPPSWRISSSLTRWARKLKISLAGIQPIEDIIFVGNGIPDNIVCLIIAHKFNEKHIVGITKPQELRINSISLILEFIKKDKKIKNIMLIIDQEENELNELWENIEEKFKEKGVTYKINKKEERFHIYICSYQDYKFRTLIVLNGLDKPYYSKHTIEDHLLEFSKELGENIESILNESNKDPKKAWRKMKNKHYEIYSNLLKYNKIEQIFPQHVNAFNSFLKN